MRPLLALCLTLLLAATACGGSTTVTESSSEPTPGPEPTATPIAETPAPPPPVTPAPPPTTAAIPEQGPTPEPGGIEPADPWDELRNAELAWVRSSILDYEYTLHQSCECDEATSAPRRIRVESGQVVSVENDGEASAERGYTIDELFRQARTALFDNKRISMEHGANGVPTRGVIDVEAAEVDGGFVYGISEFTVITEGAPVDDDYLDALARWRNARIGSYVISYSVECFCMPVELDVTVTNGRVTEVTEVVLGSDDEPPPTSSQQIRTVDEMFLEVRTAIAGGAHAVRADYDPVDGRPSFYSVDTDEFTLDEEYGVRVNVFVPGTTGVDEYADPALADFCPAFLELLDIDDDAESSEQLRRVMAQMRTVADNIVETAPEDFQAGARELQTFLEVAADLADAADWDPDFFDSIDSEEVFAEYLDVELLDGFFNDAAESCQT